MVASNVGLNADGAGKKLQTWDNLLGGVQVHAEAVCLTDSSGAEKTVALEAGNLATIAGKDFATQATLATRASEATLSAAEVHVGNIETDLALVHTHIAGVETQCTEINAHVHSIDPSSTTYKFAYVNIQADGDILALVAGKKIRVHSMVIHAIDTSSGTIETGAGAGAIKLKWSLAAREGMVLPFSPAGWFETVAGEALYADFVVGAETVFTIVYSEV